ncbi:MAG: nucleotidyl transferase AbiEii/AbiGii toxin family protein [Candidatus Omnitrophota bacterium]|nr:nucleotidyl transferase AbiEii/AbiGii toxin family protein [Candidatus Omnitrophota bacterium]
MDFEKVLTFLLENFNKYGIRYALMGGFALHTAGYTRATQDIDILILKEDAPKAKKLLVGIGYTIVHESGDVVNFKGGLQELGQIDFLLAHRSYTMNMLKRARECEILKGKFTVNALTPEDIIGLKVQASANDPSRERRDMADVEELLRRNRDKLDLNLLREYFSLFGRAKELKQLIKKTKHA